MLLLFLFLGPIFRAFLTLIFIGTCFLLILSYLAVKVVILFNVTIFGEVLLLDFFFSLIFFCYVLTLYCVFDLYQNFFQVMAELILLKLELQSVRTIQLVVPFLFVFFFSPNISNTFFYILFSSLHSKKSSSL